MKFIVWCLGDYKNKNKSGKSVLPELKKKQIAERNKGNKIENSSFFIYEYHEHYIIKTTITMIQFDVAYIT